MQAIPFLKKRSGWMNSKDRVLARLAGAPVDRIPNFNIMMTFAAHYINKPLSDYYLDYRTLAAANFAVQHDFDLDILQAISDPYREAHDLGSHVQFPLDSLPICLEPLILNSDDLCRLHMPNPQNGKRMRDRLQAVDLFRRRSDNNVMIMGWVEGAMALSATLRGVHQILLDLYDEPAWLDDLLGFCCELEIAFAVAQLEAGADIIGVGDAVASQISPDFYRRFALPYEQKIFSAIRNRGGLGRLHICGDTSRILSDMAATGADIIDIDWMVDMQRAATIFADRAVVCGNHNPVQVMRFGQAPEVEKRVQHCMRTGGSRCLSAAGCEIPDATPAENLHAQTAILIDMAQHH
jgi:MtaA/CmuA family methyltransferase